MPTVAYADSDAFETYSGQTAPADIDRLLLRASELIDNKVTAPFYVDAITDLPTDADTLEALEQATCAQVEAWVEVGEENDIDGLAGSQVSTGSYSGKRATELCPRARRLLHNAGLLNAIAI